MGSIGEGVVFYKEENIGHREKPLVWLDFDHSKMQKWRTPADWPNKF